MTDAPRMFDDVDPSERYYRQVAKSEWIRKDGISTQAFAFSSKSRGSGMSVDQASEITPEDAYKKWLAKGNSSAGTWYVTPAQVERANCNVVPDKDVNDPAHANIFHNCKGTVSDSKQKRLQERAQFMLAAAAFQNGRLYPEDEPAMAG